MQNFLFCADIPVVGEPKYQMISNLNPQTRRTISIYARFNFIACSFSLESLPYWNRSAIF